MWKHGRRLLHTLAAVAMGAAGSALLWAQTTITGPGPMTVGTTDATDVNLVTGNTARVIVSSAGHLLPAANNTYNLGSNTLQWGSAWLGGNLSVSGSTVTLSGIPGGSTATDVLVRTGTGDVQYRAASGLVGTYAWLLTGNSITSAWNGSSGNFLGTTSTQPLVIATTNTTTPQPIQVWVGNQETFRFNPPGSSAPAWSIQRGGGNQRGLHAVDLQSARSAATQVASGDYSVIGGGYNNTAIGYAATIGGGYNNTASGSYATVGGGNQNTASGPWATVGGGGGNTAGNNYATVGGGLGNTASGYMATVGGGLGNTASGYMATVGGGGANTASGIYSAIPGGYNLRVGDRSFGFSGQTSSALTDLSTNSNIAAFVDVDLWLYSRDFTNASQLRFYEAQAHGSGANYVALRAPTSLSANTTYTLPASLTPTSTVGAGILQTDASGNLSWLNPAALGGGGAGWALTGNSGTDPAVNFLGTTDAQPLVIRTNNLERVRVTANGNVGIGTPNPTYRVSIQATGNDNYLSMSENQPGGADGFEFQIAPGGGSPTTRIGYFRGKFGDANGGFYILNARNAPLRFGTNNTERMRIDGNGNVGIGTASPTERLQVSNGNIAITNTDNTARQLRLYEPSGAGTNFTAFQAQAQANDIIYTLPADLTAGPLVPGGRILQSDGSGNLSWLDPSALGGGGAGWALTGNSGTNPAVNFLGTTDAQPLVIRVNNTQTFQFNTNLSLQRDAGGITRGQGAVDLQSSRSAATQVASGNYSVIGGGQGNTASGYIATVGGGEGNTASGIAATVGGGFQNTAIRWYATVGGGSQNTASGWYATVGGGALNTASGAYATVGGGEGNTASGQYATVGGGESNTASGQYATVGGGWQDTASGDYSTVGGGWNNTASGSLATVGGGALNTASGGAATVGGGEGNTASGSLATVGGGLSNTASGHAATVGGGRSNTASGGAATVGGGYQNTASNGYATVGGGLSNTASGGAATVGGGALNTASGAYATVGGGYLNTAIGWYATVGGGYQNTASNGYATVGGGSQNTASGSLATVGGGSQNTASGSLATVGGGAYNTASGDAATVGGGSQNTASGHYSTVGGGLSNTASGSWATVGGGFYNTASGDYSAIPGGSYLRVGHRSFGFSGQTSGTETDLSADTNIAAFVDVDLWLYSRDHTQASQLRFYEAQAHGSGANYVALQAPTSLSANTTYTLPADLTPTSTVGVGILQTSANGDLSWLDPSALGGAAGWALTGNSGTDPAVNFLGTTDAQPLVIRVGNQETFRFNPPGTSAPAWSIQRGGGDPRGLHAVDLQSARSAATQVASGDYSVIGGGVDNTASGDGATVGGGGFNTASGEYATVGGGGFNTASGEYATVGGGQENTASDSAATVGGGYQNTASGEYATVGGGRGNTASGSLATVGGGSSNTASGSYATVGGGAGNTASGGYSVVPGGYGNTANAGYNLVFGENVDPSVTETHRVYFFGDGGSRPSGFLVINRLDGDHPIHVGTNNTNGNGAYLTAAGVWTNGSSRSFKERFVQYRPAEVLEKIRQLPVEGYFYKGTEEYHITPMAEDFYRLFGTGVREIIETDSTGQLVRRPNPDVDKYLAASDVAGVALLGVKALDELISTLGPQSGALAQRLEALEQENQQIKQENQHLQQRVEVLQQQNGRLQQQLEQVMERLALVEAQLQQGGSTAGENAWLGQNIPNPFAGTTTIPYYVPAGVSRAELVVRDVGGRELKRLELAERGAHGQVVLEMGLLGSGTYEYALVLDGRVVAVKQMTLMR
jgi:hypothetical protein